MPTPSRIASDSSAWLSVEGSHDHRGDGRGGHPAPEQAQALAPRAARREPRDADEGQGRDGHTDEEGGEPVALGVERAGASGHERDHRRELRAEDRRHRGEIDE